MKNLFLLAVSMTTTFIFAQQKTPNVIPPSPEASSVFKFTEVPVSLYTGLPNITIPLFEIESGGVKVPISISYHARGIKVAEIASRVGLGWALNCGGMLSTQIRDDADAIAHYTANFNGFFENEQKRINLRDFFDANGDEIDFIPDQHYFNVNGLSGKFIHDYATDKRVMQQFTNIKFQDGNLVDDKGNKYSFQPGDYEYVTKSYAFREFGTNYNVLPTPVLQQTFTTSHLNKITTQSGSEIIFNYNLSNDVFSYMRRNYDEYNSSLEPAQYQSLAARVDSYQKRLTSISYDKGHIEFQYISRQDNGDFALSNIVVKDKNMHIIKTITFSYDYVTSPTDGNTHQLYATLDPGANKRMYLKAVQFRYGNQQAHPPYTFEYNELPLPNRHSNSQDVWGYYNGKNNGWALKNSNEYTNAAARSVDTVASEAGMLKKIIYPEGGHTKFYYEHNKVYNYFPKTVDFGDPNPIIYHETGLSHLDHSNPTLFNGNTFHRTIVIPQSVTGAVKYSLKIDGNSAGCGDPYNSLTCKFLTTISNGNVSYNLFKTEQGQVRDLYLSPGTYTLSVTYQGPGSYTPTPGTGSDEDFENSNNFNLILRWGETGPADGPMYAGGKRIQKIENFDPVTGQTLTKTYNYNEPGSTQTSGRLLGLPNFRFIANGVQMLGGATYNVYSHFGNVPGSPLSTYQEQSVGYGTVTEYTGEGNNVLGKTVHTFTMTPDGGDYYTFPYHPPADNEWLRGKELTATYYKKNLNGSFTTIKKIENEYLYGGSTDPLEIIGNITYRGLIGQGLEDCGDPNAPGLPIQCLNFAYIKNSKQFRLPLALFYYPSANFYDPIKYKAYTLTGGTMDLGQTTVTDYFDGGLQLVSNTKYKYRYDNHYNVSEEEQTKSTGTAVTKYFYASDPEMAGKPARQALIDNNIVAAPLVTQSFRGINKISEIETVFKDWGGFLAPEVVKTSKGDFGLEERLIYTKMDPVNGNILEVKQANGILISYVWGYNNQYPIAKLENCAYSTIPIAILNDLKVMSNADNDNWFSTVATNEDNLNNRLKDLRAALPDALVTTLTYDPLIGVTRSTDARGNCIKYKYDRFGRLIAVIDHEGKILSETEYHYQN